MLASIEGSTPVTLDEFLQLHQARIILESAAEVLARTNTKVSSTRAAEAAQKKGAEEDQRLQQEIQGLFVPTGPMAVRKVLDIPRVVCTSSSCTEVLSCYSSYCSY